MRSLDSRVTELEKQDAPEQSKQRGLIRLTGLWKSESKAGSNYLAGSLSPSSRLLILPNTHKKQASDPDYIAYLAPPQEKKEAEPAQPEQKSWL